MPRPKVFTIGLSAADREFLVKLTRHGTHPARMIMRARVLLELDENAGPVADRAVIADRVGTSENTVRAVAKRFADTDGDVLATIGRKPRQTPPVAPIVTGEVEARLIALACSTPPEGYHPLVAATAGASCRPGRGSARSGPLHHRPGVKKRNCVLI